MASRQKEWARKVRNQLHFLLGGVCCDCGTKEKLSLDCDIPQGNDHHRRMDWSSRMSFYRKQFFAGNLKLRCLGCNGVKGGTTDKAYHHVQRHTHTHTHRFTA